MDQAELDRFADEYHDQHRENVAVTGERPEYFAEYKIRKLRQVVDRSGIGASRICGSGIGNPIPVARNLAQRLAESVCNAPDLLRGVGSASPCCILFFLFFPRPALLLLPPPQKKQPRWAAAW